MIKEINREATNKNRLVKKPSPISIEQVQETTGYDFECPECGGELLYNGTDSQYSDIMYIKCNKCGFESELVG